MIIVLYLQYNLISLIKLLIPKCNTYYNGVFFSFFRSNIQDRNSGYNISFNVDRDNGIRKDSSKFRRISQMKVFGSDLARGSRSNTNGDISARRRCAQSEERLRHATPISTSRGNRYRYSQISPRSIACYPHGVLRDTKRFLTMRDLIPHTRMMAVNSLLLVESSNKQGKPSCN